MAQSHRAGIVVVAIARLSLPNVYALSANRK